MYPSAQKIKSFLSVLAPSALGGVFYTFFAVLTIFLNQFEVIQQYLQVPLNIHLGRTIASWLDHLLTATIGETQTDTLVVGLFWALVGLAVYAFLRGIARFINELGEGMEVRGFLWPKGVSRNKAIFEVIERAVFRLVALVAFLWLLFSPLALLLSGPVFVDFIGSSRPMQLIVWFAFLWLTLHLAVVAARLVMLRQRIFD
jgi:hypothetical protein